jgi:hypothetical protein
MKVKIEMGYLVLIPETQQDKDLTEKIRWRLADDTRTSFNYSLGDKASEYPKDTIEIALRWC